MPFPLLQEGCGRIWNKLQREKKRKSLNVPFALRIVCLLTGFLPFLPFPCHPPPHSSHLEREYDLFHKGCLPWGQSWGLTRKPWFELTIFIPALNSFEPTLLKPLAIDRGNRWKCHWRRYVEWRRRGLFISLSCTGSKELLLRQYFNATLAI